MAIANGSLPIAATLLKAGANPDVADRVSSIFPKFIPVFMEFF
jgi:hypothetical protein